MRNAVHKLDGRVSGLNGFTVVLKMRSLLTAGFMSTKVKLAIPMQCTHNRSASPRNVPGSNVKCWRQRILMLDDSCTLKMFEDGGRPVAPCCA